MDSVSNNGFFPSVALARSMPVNFRLCSNAPQVRKFVRSIVEAAGAKPPPKGVVCLLILNFLRLRYSDPRRLLGISGDRNFYTAHPVVSYAEMKHARVALETMGYIEQAAKGVKYRDTGKGYTGRWRGTERLIHAAAEAGIRSTMIHSKGPERLIELRPPKKKPVRNKKATTHSEGKAKGVRLCHWPNKFRLEKKQMEENLRAINQALKESFIALNVTDHELDSIQEQLGKKREEVKYIDFFDKSLYRVFNDCDPHLGGRFYGGFWQAVPRKYRERIWIAAPGHYPAHTIELDYSEMQPRMLYAKAGLPCATSPYEIYDDPVLNKITRGIVKTMFLPMMNAVSKPAALRAARNSFVDAYDTEWIAEHPGEKRPSKTVDEMLPEGCPPLTVLVNDIEARHSEIKEKFYDPTIGKQLMFHDSQIAEAVMLRMIREVRTVALPIHDSFIVRKGYDSDLNRIMEQEFHRLFETPVKTKQPSSVLGRWPGDGTKDSRRLIDVFDTTDLLDGQKLSPRSVYETLLDDWQMTHRVTGL
jgi:hypothetical protein